MKNGHMCQECDRKEWRLNGLKHRIKGPAVIYNNGKEEYWFMGMMANSHLYKYNAKRYGITPQKYEYVFDYDAFKGTKIIGPNHRRFIHQTEIDL